MGLPKRSSVCADFGRHVGALTRNVDLGGELGGGIVTQGTVDQGEEAGAVISVSERCSLLRRVP